MATQKDTSVDVSTVNGDTRNMMWNQLLTRAADYFAHADHITILSSSKNAHDNGTSVEPKHLHYTIKDQLLRRRRK